MPPAAVTGLALQLNFAPAAPPDNAIDTWAVDVVTTLPNLSSTETTAANFAPATEAAGGSPLKASLEAGPAVIWNAVPVADVSDGLVAVRV